MNDTMEKVARAMCAEGGHDPDERMPNDGPRWRYYTPGAEAALSVLAPGTLWTLPDGTEMVAASGRGRLKISVTS